jgi:hypothetical protein
MIMRKPDYSKNAELLDWEAYDYDTKDVHETGINDNRMRLPDRYDIAKFYKRNKRPSSYDEFGNPRYEKGQWVKKAEEDLPDISDDFDWQITYNFPAEIHNNISPLNKVYGGAHVTYRRLYLILCERFNEGEFFVDEYFNSVYPSSYAKEAVDVELNNLKGELLYYLEDLTEGAKITTRGTLDKRATRVNRGMASRIREWEDFAREWEEEKGYELAEIIKDDIIRALGNGEIPLRHTMSAGTKKKRIQVGYEPEPLFFAMGDLIEHIQLYVKIGGNGQWRTEQGLVV